VYRGCNNDGVVVLESVEPEDVWESRRILVSLRIERAGLELLSERGFDDVTVDQIATAAAISTRTFFRYFRNPRDVLTAVPLRESRRMCRALLARPADESLLDSFHAWFRGLHHRDRTTPNGGLELETLVLWSGIVRRAPELIQSESRAVSFLSTELEEVVRRRFSFGAADEEKVGVLSAAFAAVIWYVFTRSLSEGDGTDLFARLDDAFDLLGRLDATGGF
jgi:AcrR family transcriptional regulator